jgi:hypothetical protein
VIKAADNWTEAQIDEFAEQWRKKASRGKVKVIPPLPLRTRVRLAAESVIHTIAYRLSKNHWRMAVYLYKACGMWSL